MFQPPFSEFVLNFYVHNLFLELRFFHLENCFWKIIYKSYRLQISTNVHKMLLYATIERHFKIYVYESTKTNGSHLPDC